MYKTWYKSKLFLLLSFLFALLICLLVCITNKKIVACAETGIELTIINIEVPDHVYDGTKEIRLSGGELKGVQEGDEVSLVLNKGVAAQSNIGNSIPITTNIQLTGPDASKYDLIQPSDLSVNIIPKSITITGVTASDRDYDGTTAVTLSGGALQGVVQGDDLTFTLNQGEVDDKLAGNKKAVTTNINLTGEDYLNYILQQPTDLEVNITRKTITISGVTANDRDYDGTTAVTLSGGALQGVIQGDDVTFTLNQGEVNDKLVGDKKAVATNIELTGEDYLNYTLQQPTDLEVNITRKTITISGVTANDRDYDGTTAVTLLGGALQGVVQGDDVTFTLNQGEVADKLAGNRKAVTTNIDLIGEDHLNYVLQQPTDLEVNITRKTITISGVTANDRDYDGTTAVTLSGGALQGVVNGDDIFFTLNQGTLADKLAQTDKLVVTNIVLNGLDSSNYIIQQPDDVIVNITKKDLTINEIIVNNRDYDGTTIVAISGGVLQGVISGDDVTYYLGEGVMLDKNVGTQKAVTTNIFISGNDSSNYSLIQPVLYIDITPRRISIKNVFAFNRTINGKQSVELVGGLLVGVVENDIVDFNLGSGEIESSEKGKYIVKTAIALTGIDSANYILEQPANISVEVFAKDKDVLSTCFIISTIVILIVMGGLILIYFLKIRNKSKVPTIDDNRNVDNDSQSQTNNSEDEIRRLKQSIICLEQQKEVIGIEKNKIENELHEELKALKGQILSLTLQLNEKKSVVDVIPVLKNAILPFVEKLLFRIHYAEDNNLTTCYIDSIRIDLNHFLTQTLDMVGIQSVYSELENQGKILEIQDVEVVPKYTTDRSKDGKLFRTLRPGIMINGRYLFHEKVEIWLFRENNDS